MFKYLYRHSIWHPQALDPEEFKYRHLKRVWLPLFDFLSVLVGALGLVYGSTLLNALFTRSVIEFFSGVFIVASVVAFLGVVFPALWLPEMAGKLLMLSLLGAYSLSVWIGFFSGDVYSGFVAAVLVYPVLFPLFRLQVLGEEVKQRRVERDA